MRTLRRTASLVLILATLTLSGCSMLSSGRGPAAASPPTPAGSATWKEPPKGYLPDGGAPDGLKILPAPPAAESAAAQGERANFDATRALEGTSRWIQAQRDADLSGKEAFLGFSCAAGVKIGPETTPTLAKMLLRLIHDGRPVYNPAKEFYARKRPASGNDAPICVPRESWIETNGAYPSGHSLIGWTWALVLTELVPDRATDLATRGREFGDSRAICGLHWQSDVEAGRILAASLVARLHAEPAFLDDMATARAEVTAARTLDAPLNCPAG